MATVLGVGVGIFVLAFLWALTFLLCLIFSRTQGGLRNAVVGVFLGALIITLVLVFFPIEDPTASETVDYTIYDNTIIGRSLLVAFMGLFVIIGGVFVFIFHWMDPIQAKPLKKIF